MPIGPWHFHARAQIILTKTIGSSHFQCQGSLSPWHFRARALIIETVSLLGDSSLISEVEITGRGGVWKGSAVLTSQPTETIQETMETGLSPIMDYSTYSTRKRKRILDWTCSRTTMYHYSHLEPQTSVICISLFQHFDEHGCSLIF